ncbi:MAG: phosphate signaling complex protein PhoU, partial [Hyphomicrobiales bacterium]
MADHIVTAFDDDIEALKRNIALMGGLAEEHLAAAIDALVRNDLDLADKVIADDVKIDDLERDTEEKAVLTIAKRQPMASDLREIMVSIRIASDLERVGDLAKNIAKRCHALSDDRPTAIITGMRSMGKLAQTQLKDVLDAYIQRDAAKAKQVWVEDEELDAMYNSVFRELLTYMMEDPRNIGFCTHLLFGAKNIERIGDHATNIAENVHYLVHGVV